MVHRPLFNNLHDVLGYFKLGQLTYFAITNNSLAICLICVSAVKTWSQLMAIRALQGLFECTISPGFLLIVGTWYRTEEQASRALVWQSGNAFFLIVCDLIMYGIARHVQKIPGGIAAWRTISLFLGSLTIALAIASVFLLGTPKEVMWLSKREKRMA